LDLNISQDSVAMHLGGVGYLITTLLQFTNESISRMHTRTCAPTHAFMHAHAHMHACTSILQPSWILSETNWVRQHQKGKTRKVKPIWIYWSKRQWVAVASAGPYANLHLDPDT